MNIVVIPFHDWRKIISEGFRTRDSHFIESLDRSEKVDKVIVINRPTTILEIILKKKRKKIEGEIILNQRGLKFIKVTEKIVVVDYVSNDIIGQVKNRFLWFIQKYEQQKFITFINECLSNINVSEYFVLSQNIFASRLAIKLRKDKLVFDAWDNFLKIDDYFSFKEDINTGYDQYHQHSDFWITNSNDNIRYFSEKYTGLNIQLIKNGVDSKRFNPKNNYEPQIDLELIPRPIVGFGGKITQTINLEILNYAIMNCPEVSFVFLGQILDQNIYNSILKSKNVFYLGDKHYDKYPNYVNGFDICLVPYYVEESKSSGTNPIKVYEYLSLGKKVIGTNGNGLEDLKEYLYTINNKEELVEEINRGITNDKTKINIDDHSWDTKTQELLDLLN